MGMLKLAEQAAASTPVSGSVVIYPKTDGLLYMKDDTGTETLVTTPGYVLQPRKNGLINGNFQVWQRGTSFTTINEYAADRWRSWGGPQTFTISRVDSLTDFGTSRYAMRVQRNNGISTTNNLNIAQGIESLNSYKYRGKTVTLSFRARRGANFSGASNQITAGVFYGTGTDENPVGMTGQTTAFSSAVTLDTTVTTFTVTGTISSSATQVTVWFTWTPTGTAGVNDYYDITDVQLEVGSSASEYEQRSYADELLDCQRYYINTNNQGNTVGGTWDVTSGRNYHIPIHFPVKMRAAPTMTWYNWSSVGFGTPTFQQIGISGANIYANASLTGAGYYLGYYSASIEL